MKQLVKELKRFAEESVRGNFDIELSVNKASVSEAEIICLFNEAADLMKKKQRELDDVRLRFDTLAEFTGAAIWDMEVDPNNTIGDDAPFWFSDQYRKILGYSGESEFPNVLGSWNKSLHPEDAKRAMDAYDRHLADKTGQTPYDSVYRLRKKDGDYIHVRERGKTLRLADGTPCRCFGLVEDISHKMQMEALIVKDFIREIEELSKSLARASEDTVSLKEALELGRQHSAMSEQNAADASSVVAEIKNITRYTNILSLNAAVEAAKAGAYGAGFSVVAGEVRILASQSRASAEKIETKLESIVELAGTIAESSANATLLASELGELMQDIKERTERLDEYIARLRTL